MSGSQSRANQNVTSLVEAQARGNPSSIALADGCRTVTYAQLEERSRTLAALLISLGVKRASVVALCLERSIAFVISALGVMRAGAAYLPLEPAYPTERLQFQIDDSGTQILIITEAMNQKRGLVAQRVVYYGEEGTRAAESPSGPLAGKTRPEDLAYVIYTSGSTGRPKGVEICHGSLANLISWHLAAFQVEECDRASQLASVGFDAAVWEVWPYLAAGASVHLADDLVVKDPVKLRDWLVENAITCSFAPTRLAEYLIALEWPEDVPLRVLLTGGERLQRYPSPGLPFVVVNNYGPTECTVVATSAIVRAGEGRASPPPIGQAIANTSLYVLDKNLEPVQLGKEGEICIAGAGLARGYRGHPELTAERFRPNPLDLAAGSRIFRTGDIGRILADGQLAYVGRIDSQVKIRGCRTEPEEVEFLLHQHPSVRESAVVASESLRGGTRLVAFVATNPCCEISAAELRSFLAARVPEHMIPLSFVWLESLPVTESGKTDRVALRNLDSVHTSASNTRGAAEAVGAQRKISGASGYYKSAAGMPGNETNSVQMNRMEPGDDTERKLQGIWREILQVHAVALNADFFLELGGDSLQAVQLLTEIENTWGVKLSVAVLLERRTVEGVAQEIRRGGEPKRGSPLVALQMRGTQFPIFCIHSHDGDALFCRHLPEYTGRERPVYAFQSQALAGGPTHFTVEEAAASYVEEVLRVQPKGPCSLFGFCYGGLVAFEMAQRLIARGRRVSFLCMFNVPAPGSLARWPLGQLSYLRKRIGTELRRMGPLGVAERRTHLLRNAQNFGRMLVRSVKIDAWRLSDGIVRPATARRLGEHLLDLEQTNIAAGKNYKPGGVFPGRISYLVSQELPYPYAVAPETGWKPFASGGIEIVQVPSAGNLHPREAMLRVVAEELRKSADKPACERESKSYPSAR